MARRDFKTSTKSNMINAATGKPVSFDSRELFGERIRYFRKKAGYLQPALAAEIGVTKNTISNWEAGRARPDLDNIVQMCQTLGITPSQLFGIAGDLTKREKTMLQTYRSLTGVNKQLVDSMMSQLLSSQKLTEQKRPELTVLRKEFRPLAAGLGDPSQYYEEGESLYVHSDAIYTHVDYVFSVNGDSMEPDYSPGDLVMVQIVSKDAMAPGMIGAFSWDNELFIKELRENGLYSHNPDYQPMLFSEGSQVFLIGKVVGILDKKDIASPEEIKLYEAFATDAR